MAKIELNRVLGLYVEAVKADKDYENGQLVGIKKLVEGEDRLYEPQEATADNHYLITTPEVDPTNTSRSLDFVNKKGVAMRVHQLEVGDTVTVEQKLHNTGFKAGDALTVTAGKFAKGEGGYRLEKTRTIGADRRPAYQIRRVK